MDLNEQVEKLAQETSSLLNDLKERNELVKKQKNTILESIRKLNDTLKEHSKAIAERRGEESHPYKSIIHLFPISSQESLDKIEANLNSSNRKETVAFVQALLQPGGFKKNLPKIMAPTLIMEYNVDGVVNKKRIRDYPKLMDIFFRATYKEGWNHKYFLEELRVAFKRAKRQHFKKTWAQRKTMQIFYPKVEIEEVILPCDINE